MTNSVTIARCAVLMMESPLEIEKNCVVSFHYSLTENGNPLENSDNGDPMACLIGAGNIIPGLEQAMLGHRSGDEFSVTVAPENAYGDRKTNLLTRVSAKHLGVDARKLNAGMVLRIQTKRGPQMMRVIKAGRFMVDLDANHPMAGLTLTFDIKIEDVREASQEEIRHGHAHGPGGPRTLAAWQLIAARTPRAGQLLNPF
nr:FKBP-type peptidyl-prolyl cis-trans isomerase SlyD-like [Nerophis lumbriciformis]